MSKHSPAEILAIFAQIVVEHVDALHAALGKLAAPAPSDEDLHQFRVTLRRLRSAWVTFAPVLPAEFVGAWKPRLRELAAATGPVREWDVLLLDWLPTARAGLSPEDAAVQKWLDRAVARAQAARDRAWRKLQTELASPDLRAMLDALKAAVAPFLGEASPGKQRAFAHARARALRRRVIKRGRRPKRASATQLHQARIAAKQWRYLYESFYPALGARASKRRRNHLRVLQDALGEVHDADASLARLRQAQRAAPPAAVIDAVHARAIAARANAAKQLRWVRTHPAI